MSRLSQLTDTDVVDIAAAEEAGLSDMEFARAQKILGRVPNKVELGCIASMWSEHCSYKSSRVHLKKLPSEGPRVVQGPGENAGIIDIGDGLGVCFKVESHNHPSFIEPFQGSATGVGGILRDVFTMGARPIALGNLLRFGAAHHEKTPRLFDGVVRGIGHYGNCFGAPTSYTDVAFANAFNGNILVNAFALGIVPLDGIFLGTASGVGNPIFYVGAKTGRDGIHGATMASDAFSDDEELERPTVQVGDPFREKLLLEACLECFATDALVGIQDMGAAGLTSSTFEMASRAGGGVHIDLDKVPTREAGMSAYEKMLSESQERMVLVAHKGKEQVVRDIFAKWELDCVEIGRVTDDGMVVLEQGGQEVARVPARPLADEAPKYDRPCHPATMSLKRDERVADMQADNVKGFITRLMPQPDVASRRFVLEQFDRHVGASTLVDGMHSPAAVHDVVDSPADKAVSLCLVARDDLCAIEPSSGALRTVQEAYLRICAVGHEPIGVSDCLNHGNPQNPEQMNAFVEVIEGLAQACGDLSVPVVSGNVSLYNETDGRSIWPTPTIAMVGLGRGAPAMTVAPGDAVVLFGAWPERLEGAFGLRLYGKLTDRTMFADWAHGEVLRTGRAMREAVAAGQVARLWPMVPGGVGRMAIELFDGIAHGLEVVVPKLAPGPLAAEDRPVGLGIAPQATVEALTRQHPDVQVVGKVLEEGRLRFVDGTDEVTFERADLARRDEAWARIVAGVR